MYVQMYMSIGLYAESSPNRLRKGCLAIPQNSLGGWKWNGTLAPKALTAETAIVGLSALKRAEIELAEAHVREDDAPLVGEVTAKVVGLKLSEPLP